jgi:hypothetical protein
MRFAARWLVAGLLAVGGVIAIGTRGWAEAPSTYGWWYEANAGLPVAPPAPPSVPSGGLYIENGFDGPTAIAALSVQVPSGAAIGPLVLHIAGLPVMSQPPIACPLRSASFKPAQDGPWSDRPQYDCQRAQKIGTIDSARTSVSFDVSPFLHGGAVAVAILAGGPLDQIAFDKPGPDTLGVTPAGGPVGAGPVASPASSPVPLPASAGSEAPSPQSSSSPPALDGVPAASGLGLTPESPVATEVAPSPPGSRQGSGPSSALGVPSRPAQVVPLAGHASHWRSRIAQVLGVAALLLVLVAWSEGYGILGGRIQPLASPLPHHAHPRSPPT